MRSLAPALLIAALSLAASAPAQPQAETLDAALERARSEQAAAEAEARKLERTAAQARSEATRLEAQQAAAVQAIVAAESRITAADAQLRLVSARLHSRRQRLAREQQPAASLLAGLALMARRPPLIALADQDSTREFVRVRLLLDSTIPAIRARTAALSGEIAAGERLAPAAEAARAELVDSRHVLDQRRQRFAALERVALDRAAATGVQALGVGDRALAAAERAERLYGERASSRGARALAAELARLEPAPPRPSAPDTRPTPPPIAYSLPAEAPVVEGLGAVNASGIRSRGLTLATARGAAVIAPADGIVRFAGPFREHDGILILDHGGGWMTLLLNLSTELKRGDRVRIGEPIGRALGRIGVELSQNGRRTSPALIAGSSGSLSNKAKGG